MSCTPGKVEITGISKIFGVKLFNLRFLQGRNPEWVGRPFYAKYDLKAIWMDDLEQVTGEKFFFEEEMPIFHKAIGSEMIPLDLMPIQNKPVPPVQMIPTSNGSI
ncbi:MAG: hypothetical protein IH840_03060 [Candidatus Heimdallarchaeota archaeon]|nr:hypothetical protein [Candidatus Heimdallarchaeota archaeon]